MINSYLQSIINFLQQIMEAMGQNVQFVIDSWMEGEKTASVIWHLGDHFQTLISLIICPIITSL